MATFIELTDMHGKKFLINLGAARTIVPDNEHTLFSFSGGVSTAVKESYDEVADLIAGK